MGLYLYQFCLRKPAASTLLTPSNFTCRNYKDPALRQQPGSRSKPKDRRRHRWLTIYIPPANPASVRADTPELTGTGRHISGGLLWAANASAIMSVSKTPSPLVEQPKRRRPKNKIAALGYSPTRTAETKPSLRIFPAFTGIVRPDGGRHHWARSALVTTTK